MTPLQWIQVLAALASALAAGLAWALRGPSAPARDALAEAKDQEIAALKDELDALRELTPVKIRAFFLTARRQLKEYCALLEEAYDGARHDLARCETELAQRQSAGPGHTDEVKALAQRRERLTAATQAMKAGLREVQHQCEYPDSTLVKLPTVNPATIAHLTAQCLSLAGPSAPLTTLSTALQETYRYRLDENTLFSDVQFTRPATGNNQAEVWQRPDNNE